MSFLVISVVNENWNAWSVQENLKEREQVVGKGKVMLLV